MGNEEEDGKQIGEMAKAVAEIAKAVPIYPDAIQPAAKEFGKTLHLAIRTVNAALMPVEALVWGADKIRDFVRESVEKKLNNVPPEDVQQPKLHIAVPAIDALRYTGDEPELSDLYANLLATSMDKATAYRAHPAFVDMIKNMSPDEARIMRFISADEPNSEALINIKHTNLATGGFTVPYRHLSLIGFKAICEHPLLTPNYLDNLARLGLIEFPQYRLLSDEPYREIEDSPEVIKILEELRDPTTHITEVEKMKLQITDLGKQFARTCVIDKIAQERN